MDDNEEEQSPISLSKHIFEEFRLLVDPSASADAKVKQCEERWIPNLQDPADAFITFSGDAHQGHLPSIPNWNSSFRKAYTVLFWIRPRLGNPRTTNPAESSAEDQSSQPRRLLYRFSTDHNDANGTGVCVTCSPWKIVTSDATDATYVQTTLTAFALPYSNPSKVGGFLRAGAPASTSFSSWTQQPLVLEVNKWHLVGCTHQYPYLKRPVWNVTVDGALSLHSNDGTNELHYPVLNEGRRAQKKHMTDCEIFHNITAGGALKVATELQGDDTKPASQLQDESERSIGPTIDLSIDLASFSLYNDYIPPNIQAVISEAGPALTQQQQHGTLPPVPNWTKGCSLTAGPKVGIPLAVHGLALEVQRLASSLYFFASAVQCRVLGQSLETRLSCPHLRRIGRTDATPRVGLIQPQPISDDGLMDDDDPSALYVTGSCTLTDALSSYLLHHGPENLDVTTLEYFTKHWSVVWSEQPALQCAILPFFLALAPVDPKLLKSSCRHLYQLYHGEQKLAVALIRLLTACLETGGARVHEQVLQNGILHILSSSLRLGLIRAHKLRIHQHNTMESFVSSRNELDELPSTSTMGSLPVPETIANAIVALLDVTCGPDAEFLEELPPSLQIRRTSDLALTSVFCLGLDWDLWTNGSTASFEAIGRKYGGTCVTSGFVLRSQISVQHLLDRMRSLKRVAPGLRRILLSMMLSSLTNQRSITQGEKDVAACVTALTESSLGTSLADVVLSALVDLLVWCEVLPNYKGTEAITVGVEEEVKVQVASKLGRNLLLSQFHDVVAPVLLSRTVFSGDTSPSSQDWQGHWQKCLVIFSWLASIAGPEGIIAAQSTGSLMLASSLAGSLPLAMHGFDGDSASTLFLPSPNMALWIGATFRNEWSYKDLLADRLHIMMPILPSLTVSLIDDEDSYVVLVRILNAVQEALERVFGGIVHSAGRRPSKQASGSADTIKAAKQYVPHLLAIAMVLENRLPTLESDTISIFKAPDSVKPRDKIDETEGTWASNSSTQELSGKGDIQVHEDSVVFLRNCQDHVLRGACGLMVHAMSIGGEGVTSSLLQTVLSVLKDPSYYRAPGKKAEADVSNDWCDPNVMRTLVRMVASLLWMCLKREEHWQVWGYELSASVTKLCQLVEEMSLVAFPVTYDGANLISVLLYVLAYGREASGWCQLVLPPLNVETNATANSKALLPVLRPTLRVILSAVEHVSPSLRVRTTDEESLSVNENLLDRMLFELDSTMTAAIVGLSFADSRDVALNALAALRKACSVHSYKGTKKLMIKITGELAARYGTERRLRNTALFNAYEDETAGDAAAIGSLKVEQLMLGGANLFGGGVRVQDIAGQAEVDDDFVVFHSDLGPNVESKRLGFDELRGLGAALDEWGKLDRSSNGGGFDVACSMLCPYLDAWDRQREKGNTNEQLIAAFQAKLNVSEEQPSQLPIIGAGAAADAMSTFFEFAAVEKNRLKEIAVRYLPGFRSSIHAFSGRFCWSSFAEIDPIIAGTIWERAVPDGNRDVRSKLATVPCVPQFSRYLPRYLDSTYQKTSQEQRKTTGNSASDDVAMTPQEMGNLTKTLLETGHVEIIDITKKEISDEEPDINEDVQNTDSPEIEANGYDQASDNGSEHNENPEGKQGSFGGMHAEQDGNNDDSEERVVDDIAGRGHFGFTTSSFATPPDNSSSSLGLMQSAASGLIEQHIPNCTHVKAEGNRQCTLLLTMSHLILEYDGNPEGLFENEELALQEEADRQRRIAEDSAIPREEDPEALLQKRDEKRHRDSALGRPKSIRWNLSEVSHIYLRRYRLRDSALELFVIPTGGNTYGGFGIFSPGTSLFLDFGPGRIGKTRRDDAAFALMRRAPPQAIKQWPDRSEQFLHEQLSRLTLGWAEGRLSNFDYLLHLNILSGRSYNDICQYPVFPWVLSDYTSEEIPNLTDPKNFRDLTKPVGALNPDRLNDFLERFNTFSDPAIPAFMYGSHYSTSAGVVLHFLVRLHPFAGLHRQLQSGHFDVADRLFSSVPRTWSMCTGASAAEVKELTPEWYCNPAFLRNDNNFKLGTSQDGEVLNDVALPPWAEKSPEKFVEVMRAGLESDICSQTLPDWIDLIFGRKQQGPEAIKANNVFFYLTYYGTVDVASIEDDALRVATELQIAHFGQCPMQLFRRPHVRKLQQIPRHLTLYQVLSSHHQTRLSDGLLTETNDESLANRAQLHSVFGQPAFLPFFSAPMSHWVHSSPPPPGPHTALIAVRFAGVDRCIAVDQKGIFHYFRWAWRPDEGRHDSSDSSLFDNGCFVAQRELPRFKTVPRLMFVPLQGEVSAVAISKTLFANRSLLLVLSDGDGNGSLGMQLVDPIKGDVRGQVVVPQIHSSRLTCIATDPIGTAAGHGGVGGELALVGSADGNASLWRFMSSHFLPMRPRVHLRGHSGEPVVAVALCSTINLAATVSPTSCCLYSTSNGALIRSFGPPSDTISIADNEDVTTETRFAHTSALALSVQGYVATVCETTLSSSSGSERTVFTLHLFSMEGVSLGSKPLEKWRGVPKKMYSSLDGTFLLVCCGRGVSMHRLSAYQPLEFLDEFQVADVDDFSSTTESIAWDVDLGPALNRPVVAAAGCTAGALRLHALPGISAWSEKYKKTNISKSVGSALSTPAKKLSSAIGTGFGFGQRIAGVGRELKREVESDVRERGVGGFLGSVVFGKGNR